MRIPGAKLLQINFHFKNSPEIERSEYATAGVGKNDANTGELLEIGNRIIGDAHIFFNFMHDDAIEGDQGDFVVRSFFVIDSNPIMAPSRHRAI